MYKSGFAHLAAIFLILTGLLAFTLLKNTNSSINPISVTKLLPTPIPTPIAHYSPPTINKNEAYTIIFVGDSMIDSLGENFDYLRQELATIYPSTVFGLFNYGYGATNINALNERLHKETTYRDITRPAILGREFDIIIIGSFGHNPLSNLPLEEGLQKHNSILDEVISKLATQKPNAVIIFLAEFAPLENDYAKNVVDLNQEQRSIWVSERKAYIENHIKYAQGHNIPLINIYEKSSVNGDVELKYISPDSYIHPSSTGLIFMSQEIANYISSYIPN
jgi:hypothetical protein